MEEVVISSARGADMFACAWDFHTGTVLNNYRPCTTDSNSVDLVRNEYLVTSQSGSTTISFWNLKKSQPIIKSSPPEKISCLKCTKDGVYCIGGSITGSIHVWEIASGTLLKSWEAHYKKVTAIALTDDDSLILSGGEDSVINVWNLADVLDRSQQMGAASLKAYHTWSEHSLPITNLYCGYGGVSGRAISVSLDRTCKMWDISTKAMLCSIIFPSGLTCCVMDFSEKNMFVGAMDSNIYQIDLFSTRSITDESLNEQTQLTFQGHTQTVTCIAVSFNAESIVSGSEDGTCRIWDIVSRQQIRSFTHHKGPITNIILTLKPNNWVNTDEKVKNTQLVASFKKFSNEQRKEVPILLGFADEKPAGNIGAFDMESRGNVFSFIKNTLQSQQGSRLGSNDNENAKLRAEILQLKEENARWKSVNNELLEQINQDEKMTDT